MRLITALEACVDGWSMDLRRKTLNELDAKSTTRERLIYLSGLLSQALDPRVMQRFEDRGLFEPASFI